MTDLQRPHRNGSSPRTAPPWTDAALAATCRGGRARLALAALLALGLLSPPPAPAGELAAGLSLVERGYLFQGELDAEALFGKALEYAEGRVPELEVHRSSGGNWILETTACGLQVPPPIESSVFELAEPLGEVASFLDQCVRDYPEEAMPPEPLLLQGLLSGLDPYSTILDGRRRTEHSIQFQGKLAGIGARIGIRDDQLTLITVYPESPADRAGLRDDDVILRIEELSTTNILVTDAVERIRGEEGSVVNLLVQRDGEAEPLPVAVTRGIVLIPSVTSRRIGDVIYADISHFSQTTPEDFRKQVEDLLSSADETAGVVIDLRRNSGGSMLGSSSIGDFFLNEGVLIRTSGRGGAAARGLTSEVMATEDTPFVDLPVVFLSAPRTASGSELLAASLRNNDRAIIVGERSYGKGTVQKTFNVGAESTLKMTVGHFLPNGAPIPGGGLIPDIEIRSFTATSDRLVLPFEKATGDLPFWLRYPEWAGEPPSRAPFVIDIAQALAEEGSAAENDNPQPEKDESADDPAEDPTVELAAELLSRFGNTSAAEMLGEATAFLAQRAAATDSALVSFFAERNIDWQPGERPKDVRLSLAVTAKEPLRAGRKGTLEVTITNEGDSEWHRLRGRLEAQGGGLGVYHVAIGRVAAGGSVTRTVAVKPAEAVRTGRTALKLILFDDAGDLVTLGPEILAVDGGPRPRLELRHRNFAEADGSIRIAVDLRNSGDGEAREVRGRLEHPLSDEFEIVEGTALLDELPAGKTATVEFRIRPLRPLTATDTVRLLVGESVFGGFLDPKLPLDVTHEISPWLAAPEIECRGLREGADGLWQVRFDIHDPDGLAAAWLLSETGEKSYFEGPDDKTRDVSLITAWDPTKGVNPIHVVARDRNGLASFYRLDL